MPIMNLIKVSCISIYCSANIDNSLAVHTVGHSTVTWDRMSKVFDVESPLETRCEESSEWRYERGESGHHQGVDLEWCPWDRRRSLTKLDVSVNEAQMFGNR